MENVIVEIMNEWGYLGTFFLIMIENVFPPIPSELILTFGGFMTIDSELTILGVIIASTLGSVVGAIILYYVGKILNKDRLVKIVSSKYGKLLRVKPKDIESADKWFDTKGNVTVFFCRFIPIVRSLISIPAGMSEMSMVKFLVYTLSGSLIWNTALILVGAFAGEKKDMILGFIDKASNVILIALVFVFVVFVVLFYVKRKNKRKNKSSK